MKNGVEGKMREGEKGNELRSDRRWRCRLEGEGRREVD